MERLQLNGEKKLQAGVSEHAIMFPIDSIKVSWQHIIMVSSQNVCQTRMQVFATTPMAVYSGVGNAFLRISSTEGLRALWRGVSSVILGAGPAHAVHFGTLEAVKELAGGNEAGNQWIATCKFFYREHVLSRLLFQFNLSFGGSFCDHSKRRFHEPF